MSTIAEGLNMADIFAESRRRAMLLDPCPECAQGKHGNCLGQTWDPDADEIVAPCPCAEATPHEAGR